MQKRFNPPPFDPEREARVLEEIRLEEERKHLKLIECASIPMKYHDASIEKCAEAVRSYVSSFRQSTTNSLILRGEVGRGKTYSACAILNALVDVFAVRFTTMSLMLQELRSTYNGSGNESDVFSRYSGIKLLVIDDLGKEKPTEWALATLFNLMDARYRNCLPTIFTTQYNGQQLAQRLSSEGNRETAEAIVSRMQECQAVILKGPDRRTRHKEPQRGSP